MNSDFEAVKCVICNSDNYKVINKFIYLESKLNLVLCKNCGLGYLNPRWTKRKYSLYYKEQYDLQYRPNIKLEKSDFYSSKKNIILERFQKHNTLQLNPKKILDIGSGTGENLLAFKQEYPQLECYAIEPSLVSQELLKTKNIEIIAQDVDSDWQEEYIKKFDVIIMRHVLEHFLNPLEVLNKVRSVLSDNGVLYIAVPNNLLEKRNEGWLRVAHTYYFNQYTFSAILNNAAFKINSLFLQDEFNQFEIFSFAQKEKIKTKTKSTVIANSYKKQQKIFSKVFREEKFKNRIKACMKKLKLKLK